MGALLMNRGPVDLVLVRHGESEGNLAQHRSKHGIQKDWEGPFSMRHSSRYRLTDKGRQHAATAGEYIRSNIYGTFDRYYTSEYVRAMETASLLGIDQAQWELDFNLRERDMGVLSEVSKKDQLEAYSSELERRDRDLFYWQPSGGESIAGTCQRVHHFLTELQRNCSGLRVLVVCHCNILEAFRILLEKLTQNQWMLLRNSNNPFDRIHKSQIFWYSRRNPETHRVHGNMNWVQSICPWDVSRSRNEWETITRPSFSSRDLLDHVNAIPQLVNNEEELEHTEEQDTESDVVHNLDGMSVPA